MDPTLERVLVAHTNLNMARYSMERTRDPELREEVAVAYVEADEEHTLALREARKHLKARKAEKANA